MFELSLKLTDGMDIREPVIDLNMSNSMLNIHTCADTCVALMKLIKYFASDGDMHSECPVELDNDSVVIFFVITFNYEMKYFWNILKYSEIV